MDRRRLASELRRLREAANLTCEDAAARLECSVSKISRIETGQVRVSPRDTRDLLAIYGVPRDRRDGLVDLARESRQKGWWHAYRASIQPHQATYIGFEHAAAQIRIYQLSRVPGLLQTAGYARAVRAGRPGVDAERAVALLTERQWRASVSRRQLQVIIGEAALRREPGVPDVLAGQIRHLLELSALPGTRLQVMPIRRSMHLAADTSFTIMDFPDPADPDIVLVRYPTGLLCIEDPGEGGHYSALFRRLQDAALPPKESAALMTTVLGDL